MLIIMLVEELSMTRSDVCDANVERKCATWKSFASIATTCNRLKFSTNAFEVESFLSNKTNFPTQIRIAHYCELSHHS